MVRENSNGKCEEYRPLYRIGGKERYRCLLFWVIGYAVDKLRNNRTLVGSTPTLLTQPFY